MRDTFKATVDASMTMSSNPLFHRSLGALALFLSAALALLPGGCSQGAPRLEGRTIDEWVDELREDSEEHRAAVIDQLVAMGPAAVPHLRGYLTESFRFVARGAAIALVRLGRSDLVVEEMERTDPVVRVNLAHALLEANTEVPLAVRRLLEALEHEDLAIRQRGIFGLKLVSKETPEAAAVLAEALRHDDVEIRWRAAYALSHLGSAAAPVSEDLVAALNDPDDRVRRGAINALARVPRFGEAGRAAVRDASQDKDPLVRQQASAILNRLSRAGD